MAAVAGRAAVVVWVAAAALAGLVYAAVLALGSWQGWSGGPTLGVAAGAFVLTLATAGQHLERRTGAGRATDLLGALGPRLTQGVEATAGLVEVAEGLRSSVGARAVVIAPARGATPIVAGRPAGPATTIALRTRRRAVGELTVHGDTGVLRGAVEPLESELSGVVGVAVLLSELNADLAALRSRTETTRREEQQLLHSELDSTLAPIVEGVVARLVRARAAASDEPEVARRLVAEARADLARGTAGVRSLARALLPAALDHGDLGGALVELTSSAGGATWDVHAEHGERLDPRTQLACYLVAADLVGVLESRATTGVHLLVRLEVLADVTPAGMRVTVRTADRRPAPLADVHAAIEQRAVSLGLSVAPRPDGPVDIVVAPW